MIGNDSHIPIPPLLPALPPPLPTLPPSLSPPTHALLPSKFLLWDTLSAAWIHYFTLQQSSQELLYEQWWSGTLLQQTPETMLYDTLIPKKQTVSTKYDLF